LIYFSIFFILNNKLYIAFYFIITTFIQYFQYEVNVGVDLIEERPTYYPTIDICNLSPYDKDTGILDQLDKTTIYNYAIDDSITLNKRNLENFDFEKIDFSYISPIHKRSQSTINVTQAQIIKLNSEAQLRNYLISLENRANNDKNFNLNSYGYSLGDMLLSCKFRGRFCTENDFSMYHNYNYGNCYRFNGGFNKSNHILPIRKTTKPGWRFGLQLELFTGVNGVLSPTKGFRILIHNKY
jgi:hypothetical protein